MKRDATPSNDGEAGHDLDGFWKEALDLFLEEFLALVAPSIHEAIDWRRRVTSLEKELPALRPRGRKGRRIVDKLFRLYRRDGRPIEVLLHVEVEASRDAEFPRRMYVYHYRIGDKHRRPLASLAVLADSDPQYRPTCYETEFLGTRVRMDFPVIKLRDFHDRRDELERSKNPFALLLVAWFRTRESRPGRGRLVV